MGLKQAEVPLLGASEQRPKKSEMVSGEIVTFLSKNYTMTDAETSSKSLSVFDFFFL